MASGERPLRRAAPSFLLVTRRLASGGGSGGNWAGAPSPPGREESVRFRPGPSSPRRGVHSDKGRGAPEKLREVGGCGALAGGQRPGTEGAEGGGRALRPAPRARSPRVHSVVGPPRPSPPLPSCPLPSRPLPSPPLRSAPLPCAPGGGAPSGLLSAVSGGHSSSRPWTRGGG